MDSKKTMTGDRCRLRSRRGETPSEFQSRLASSAMERGQIETLQRYLAEGMSPDTLFHSGWGGGDSGAGPSTLIEWAARCGYFECFKILEAAGARITDDAIMSAIEDDRDHSVFAHLLASGTFDPRGLMQDGTAWIDQVNRFGSPQGLAAIAQAIGDLEQAELSSATPAPTTMRPRLCL